VVVATAYRLGCRLDLVFLGHRDKRCKNDYDFFPKDEVGHFTARDREVLATGRMVVTPEEPIHTRYKGTRILKTVKLPVPGKDGSAQYLLGFSKDITDQRAIKAQLRQAVKMEAVGQLRRRARLQQPPRLDCPLPVPFEGNVTSDSSS